MSPCGTLVATRFVPGSSGGAGDAKLRDDRQPHRLGPPAWWLRIGIAILAAGLSVGFAWVAPLGESPDELAHILYADALAESRLPSWNGTEFEAYEAHQPPLGYLMPALVISLRGGLDLRPERDPSLDFARPGSRAFRAPFAQGRDALTLRIARSLQALWIGLTFVVVLSLVPDERTALPFLLSPQLLYLGGAISNDAALVALATCTLASAVHFAETAGGAVRTAALATLALFTKASALLLLAPIVVAALFARSSIGHGDRRNNESRKLLAATGAGLVVWLGFNFIRDGSALPRIPTAHRLASFSDLVDPRWIGGLFVSFWAKFGSLNTPLPPAFYLWFSAVTLIALISLARSRGVRDRILLSALVANALLLVAYQLTVDRQNQGRYLFPSIAAIAVLGGETIPRPWRTAAAILATLVAIASLAFIHRVYA